MIDIIEDVSFEIYSERSISEKSLLELSALARWEMDIFIEQSKHQKPESIIQRATIISVFAQRTAKKRVQRSLPTGFVFARDRKDKLVGYSIASLGEAKLDFLGVKSSHMQRGIGTRLLRETHSNLLNLGYTQYLMKAEQDLVSILTLLGTNFTTLELPNESTRGYYLAVSLK